MLCRRVGLLLASLVLFFGTCCKSTQAYIPSPTTFTVGIESIAIPGETLNGTGIILHSGAPEGTFILTNEHVVLVRPGWSGVEAPASVYTIVMPDGTEEHAGYVISFRGRFIVEKRVIDIALLWIPYRGKTYDTFNGTDDDHVEIDQSVTICTYFPQGRPAFLNGRIVDMSLNDDKKEYYREVIRTSTPIKHGNSGSGIYDTDGKLRGIVWGMDGDNTICLFVDIADIKDFLTKIGLEWTVNTKVSPPPWPLSELEESDVQPSGPPPLFDGK